MGKQLQDNEQIEDQKGVIDFLFEGENDHLRLAMMESGDDVKGNLSAEVEDVCVIAGSKHSLQDQEHPQYGNSGYLLRETILNKHVGKDLEGARMVS